MDYVYNVFVNFLKSQSFMDFQWRDKNLLGLIKNIFFFFEDKQKSHGFVMTWGWVNEDRIFMFWWTNPLKENVISFYFVGSLLDVQRALIKYKSL